MSIPLNKEWYTVKEVSEILGVNRTVINSNLLNRSSTLIAIKLSEYKKEKNRYFIHREYILRCKNNSIEKKWLRISEACKLLKKSENWLRSRIKKGDVPKSAYRKDKTLLIHISYINKYKSYEINRNENYYTYKEISLILKISESRIGGLVKNGAFKDVIISSSGSFVSKKEIETYRENTENTITTKEIQEELNMSIHQALNFIKSEPRIIAKRVNRQKYYIKNDSYESFKKELIYTIDMLSIHLDTTYDIAKMLMEKNFIKSFNIKERGLRTSKRYIEEYQFLGLIPLEQFVMEIESNSATVYSYVHKGELKTIKYKNLVYLQVAEAERFKNSFTLLKMKYWNADKPYEFFNESIRYFRKTNFKETLILYEVWAKEAIDKRKWKNKKSKVWDMLNLLEILLNKLEKELFLYTDDELKKLLGTLLDTHIYRIYPFLNYCKEKRSCNFKGVYVLKRKENKEDEPYTKEEWSNLALEVLDVENNFKRAIENRVYAETWLYLLLHFSLAWRSSDLRELEPINLDIVGINSYKWFDNNVFTLEIAQIILKAVELKVKEFLASKNDKVTVFVIPFIFELPTALAITLCELHRRKNDPSCRKLVSSKVQQTSIDSFFSKNMPKFLSKKSNKTLMTYGWETAVKKGKGALAYWLGGFSRSHTQKIDMVNPITQVYLLTSNTDTSVDEIALHCFERGIFGWQVKVMIDCINNNEIISLNDMTKWITEVNKNYTPIMVDSISKYAVTRHNQSVTLLKELMSLPKGDIKKKLQEISKLKSPSLIDHSQCLVGVENCIYIKEVEYNLEKPCFGCKNRIDTNYILNIINVEIFDLINRLKVTPFSDEVTRIKYTHMIRSLSYILMDFKRVYDLFDPGYIRSFIDIDKLKDSFQELERTKFLLN